MATDPKVRAALSALAPTDASSVSRWADWMAEELQRAGLTVVDTKSFEVAGHVAKLLYQRTQLVDADADDLAWDILNMLRGEPDA